MRWAYPAGQKVTWVGGILALAALVGFPAAEGLAQDTLAVRAQDGRTAWAVARGMRGNEARVTEVWVADAGGQPRLVRTFPGRPEMIAWEGERLCYADEGLRLPLLPDGAIRAEALLVPGQVWWVGLKGEEDAPAPHPPPSQGLRAIHPLPLLRAGEGGGRGVGEGLLPFPTLPIGESGRPEVQAALVEMGEALTLASGAYDAAQRGEFKIASGLYRKAADWFERMPSAAGDAGLSKAVCLHYAGALRERAGADRQNAGRAICADHLRMIGGFLTACATAHEGRFPKSLAALKAWVEGHIAWSGDAVQAREAVARIFRSPADPDTGRTISYGYRVPQVGGRRGPVAWSYFYEGWGVELVGDREGLRVIDRAMGPMEADSLLVVGMRIAALDSPAAGMEALEAVTRVSPQLLQGHLRLGYACLKAGEVDRAERAFRKAFSLNGKLAEAHNGMGLVFMQKLKGLYTAMDYFREALRWDPKYVEARYHLGEIQLAMQNYDARKEAERAIEMDSKYAPAYRLMGQFYESLQEDYEQAALWYLRYLALRPDDVETWLRLGKVYLQAKNFEQVTKTLMEYVQQHPEEISLLPVLGHACLEIKRLEWAQTFFSRYLEGIKPEERALYEDIRTVASPEEAAEAEAAVKAGRGEAFVRQFWAKRDPNLMTPANERLLEHYRRVWYARQNFSKRKQPWDRRGEVYIRFGEPDHRSRYDMVNARQSLAVQRVKERMAQELYGSDAEAGTYIGPVYPVKSARHYDLGFIVGQQEAGLIAEAAEAGEGNPNLPPEPSSSLQAFKENLNLSGTGVEGNYAASATAQEGSEMVMWEAWVYTKVGGGMEITFTDEIGSGNFDYAPPVLDGRVPAGRVQKFVWYSPQAAFKRATAATPDYYALRAEAPPLNFYYDFADFRGVQDGRSLLEVYYGIPRMIGKYFSAKDSTRLVVERQVALLNLETGVTYRTQGDLVYQGAGDQTFQRGAFVPDVARLEVPPGRYRMEVTATDQLSGQTGTYRQDVEVGDYVRGRLRLSGLELAWQVDQGAEADKFSRKGMQILPLPTRTFRSGQSIFVYYEVYNLKPDAAGKTGHVLEYTVKTESGGVLSKVLAGLGRRGPQVGVSQAQAGTEEAEYRGIELDLKGLPPGKGTLTVTVRDLNSGQTASRDLTFTMVE